MALVTGKLQDFSNTITKPSGPKIWREEDLLTS
jgi:hypothetical protein